MNLLIIDDDHICSFVNTRVAETCGLFSEVRAVHNGKEALELFQQVSQGNATAPDVILLDLNMPVMNGFDFIEALEGVTYPQKDRLKIVVLTSSDNKLDIERARAMGIKHYLVKSLTAKDLQNTIFSLYNEQKDLV
jgi:CheY-like chemotaxis protein